MSDRVLISNLDADGTSKNYVHAYESAWMARWTRTSCETAIDGRSHSSLKEDAGCSKQLFLPGRLEMAISDSMFAKRARDVSESRQVSIMQGNVKESSAKPSSERRNIQPFPMFNFSQQSDSIIALKDAPSNIYHEEQRAYPKVETSLRESSLKQKNTFAVSSFQDDMGSNSKALASGSSSERPRIRSLMYEQDDNAPPNTTFEYEEKFSSKYFSNFQVYEKRTDNQLDSRRPMRIYTTVDSVQNIPREPSRVSQTTRHFLISKKTDVNFSEDGQLFGESTVSMKLRGKMFGEFLNLFPGLDSRHQRGVKLQPIGSSINCEGPEKIDEVKNSAVCIKNESSAETDTLDMDNFQSNHLSGVASSSANKASKGKQNSSASQRAEIPDMNQDLHKDESASKTRSMNVEHFLFNAELPAKPNHIESELINRWVKRLKTSASDSPGHGTKSLMTEEDLPGEKVNDFFSKIMKGRMAGSETQMMKPLSKEPIASEKLAKDPTSQDITLLHPWIQRWCQNKTMSHQTAEPEEVICEPEHSKGKTLDEFEKKRFPSIGAMALMGKALSGFSPSDLRKRGSLIVWKTREFR